MSERWLSELPPPVREAPPPRRGRGWTFWPLVVAAGIFAGVGLALPLYDNVSDAVGCLLVAAWLGWAAIELERTR